MTKFFHFFHKIKVIRPCKVYIILCFKNFHQSIKISKQKLCLQINKKLRQVLYRTEHKPKQKLKVQKKISIPSADWSLISISSSIKLDCWSLLSTIVLAFRRFSNFKIGSTYRLTYTYQRICALHLYYSVYKMEATE